mgnify:CR=1 FL=1
MRKYLIAILLLSISFNQEVFSGYLRSTEASFCMDDCSQYNIETEIDSDFGTIFVVFENEEMDIDMYLNRFVEVTVDEQQIECIECSAFQVLRINISNECSYPIECFADPCEVTEECQLNTPVDCVSNFCGGCYADFYDLENNLVDCFYEEDDDGEPNPCSDFGQEDCDWFDECVWTDSGCQDFNWEDHEQDECRMFQSQDECLAAGCEWDDEDGCYDSWDEDEDEWFCEDIDNQEECLAVGCEWEYSNNMPGGGSCFGDEHENDGPPDCMLDCDGIEDVNPEQDGMYFCEWLFAIFPTGCAEDCEQEVLDDIEEFMQVCDECLPVGNCDDYFDIDDNQETDCSDITKEEECQMYNCEWQLNPTGIGQCVEGEDFEPVCEDLSDLFFGWCEMVIGVGWNGQDCTWFSGCGTVDENNGIDYADAFFDSIEDCEQVCFGGDGGNGYAMLVLDEVVTSPGTEFSVPLYLESDLNVAGVQFSIYTPGEDFSNYIIGAGIESIDDCFSANFNNLDGSFLGIIFSLEGCTYSSNEMVHIANLIYESSSNTPSGLDFRLEFESTLVSDSQGNEILSYGEGATILIGVLGDVNSDGDINILDVISIVNFAIYVETPNESEFWAADLNGDSMLDILDIVNIVNMILDN